MLRLFFLLGLLLLTGCLPGSKRGGTQGLVPSDSLSRAFAQTVVPDTLARLGEATPPEADAFEVPTSIQSDPARPNGLVVADTKRERLYRLDWDARTLSGQIENPAFAYPYLSGSRGDTLFVFNRGDNALLALDTEGAVLRSATLPQAENTVALVTEAGTFWKSAPQDEAAEVRRLGVRRANPGDVPNARAGLAAHRLFARVGRLRACALRL